ncbi:MAG: formylmethanofuran dehydrogenase subunit E family protein [Pseudolabrys sp.]
MIQSRDFRTRWILWAFALSVSSAIMAPTDTQAQNTPPQEWIEIGTRVHGGFGALIPLGIRIGLDALQRLKASPRGVIVRYRSGEAAPCACVADGIMVATQASPGQGTLKVLDEKAGQGLLLDVEIEDRKIGATLRYRVASHWLPQIVTWNRTFDPAGRYQAVMAADGMFEVSGP